MSMMNANAAATTTMTANEPLDFELPEIGEAEFSNEELAEDMDGLTMSFPRIKIPAGGVLQFEILPVPAMLRLCPFLPLAKISPPQWQRQKTMPCWMHLSPPHRWRWRAIARLTFPLQGTVKLPCAPVAVLLLQNRPPFPLRPLSNRPL